MTAPDLAAPTIQEAVGVFVDEVVLPNVASWDRDDVLPDEIWERLVELGVPGALVPPEHGGAGRTVASMVPVWRTLSQGWISLTGAVNPTGLATALLVRDGTPQQRERWLPRFADGTAHAAFSITEPQAGSDLSRIETTAVLDADGGGVTVDGHKRWVAGGVSADVVFLLARVDGDLSCVVLPTAGRGTATWEVGELDKVGYRGVESASYRFRAHHEPAAEILGGPGRAGAGARQMLGALGVGRINVACRALGIIDRALAVALEESVGREIGDGVLGDHTHVQLRVGELRARLMAAESLTERAAFAVDEEAENARELSTAAKIIASDTAVWAVDLAARLSASRSYRAGDELARLRRDAPQTQIGEGANDALLLALGRGEIADAA